MLNNGIAHIAINHANTEKACILGIDHGLKKTAIGIAIVLWRLYDSDIVILERRCAVFEPVRINHVIAIDYRDYLCIFCSSLQRVVEGASFETLQIVNVMKFKVIALTVTPLLHRNPASGFICIVIDHNDFEILIVKLAQCCQRFYHHFGRFVMNGHVNRHLGFTHKPTCLFLLTKFLMAVIPYRFSPFVRLRQQNYRDAETRQQ